MKLSDNAALIEAILYLENEPLSIERMGKMTGLSDKEVSDAIEEISDAYYAGNHGLSLVENSETYSFVPVARLNDKLRFCYGKKIDKRLSKAAVGRSPPGCLIIRQKITLSTLTVRVFSFLKKNFSFILIVILSLSC